MTASFILMLITLLAMAFGLLTPTSAISVMIFWGTLGIMSEIRGLKPPKKDIKVEKV